MITVYPANLFYGVYLTNKPIIFKIILNIIDKFFHLWELQRMFRLQSRLSLLKEANGIAKREGRTQSGLFLRGLKKVYNAGAISSAPKLRQNKS